MRIRQYLGAAAMSIAAVTIATGSAHAAPPAATDDTTITAEVLPGVGYTADIVDNSVVLSTDAGSLTIVDGRFQILDQQGNLLAGLPLTYRRDNADYPIVAEVAGRTITLTPVTDPAAATPAIDVDHSAAVPQADAVARIVAGYSTPQERESAALGRLVQQVSVASIVGAMLGTIIGGGIGCVGGIIVGGAATAPVAWLLGAGPIAGCIGGAFLLAPIGALAGTIAVGGPILGVAVFQYFEAVGTPLAPAPGA
ncbi:hypothetical protein AB0H71_02060 [Nocardia sp. NPDC050697]|uniref:hypothetical protein n=1 Tax=Nocardia sp. NPDC050697 TaxID=3155158 RepID=UPI003407DA5A